MATKQSVIFLIFTLFLGLGSRLTTHAQATARGTDLAHLHPAFGTYRTTAGREFVLGPTAGNLFLLDYQTQTYYTLRPSATDRSAWQAGPGVHLHLKGTRLTRLQVGGAVQRVAHVSTPALENLALENEGIHLAGTLWKPAGVTAFPVVILIHGAGPETRYGMRFIPYLFLRQGIGVFTYDKRGSGESTGHYEPWLAGIPALATDVVAICHTLAKRPDVAANRLGLLGISNGAWVAQRAAAQLPTLKVVVPVVGGFIPVYQQELYRLQLAAVAAKLPARAVQDLQRTMGQLYNDTLYHRLPPVQAQQRMQSLLAHARTQPWFSLTPLPAFETLSAVTFYDLARRAWDNELAYNPQTDAASSSASIFSLLAAHDEVTPTNQVVAVIGELNGSREPQAQISTRVLPRTGHFLQVNAQAASYQLPLGLEKAIREVSIRLKAQ